MNAIIKALPIESRPYESDTGSTQRRQHLFYENGTAMRDTEQLIAAQLQDWRTGWSMGSFGAVAEFHRDRDEPITATSNDRLLLSTARGAIAFETAQLAKVKPIAHETLSPKRHRWTHAVTLCLPIELAKRAARSHLSEIGPDDAAIRPDDRNDILFDLGLSLPQCDFCIRTQDVDLLAVLRRNCGASLFEPGNEALGALLATHPHRVAITNIGRVEVYQKIGGPETGGVSPEGPHTHLLPHLMKSGRTHSANTPIPKDVIPLGAIHPANPVMDPMGRDQPYDAKAQDAFHALLDTYGLPGVVDVKRRVLQAINDRALPTDFIVPGDRFERSALRLALRQQLLAAEYLNDADVRERVRLWQRTHEVAAEGANAEDDDAPGH